MKARIKFRKYGVMRFIGHLDIMRYFQKAMRRAHIPIAFTQGFSPHMIMSFANPLGVGVTSEGEYFDIELQGYISTKDAVKQLNEVMVDGVEVLNLVELPEGQKTGMAIVAAAEYGSRFKNPVGPDGCQEKVSDFMAQPEILIVKKTKKSEKEVDIRPMIYQMEAREDYLFMQIATGSVMNLKPGLVMKAFAIYLGLDGDTQTFDHCRLNVFANTGTEDNPQFIPLDALGNEIK